MMLKPLSATATVVALIAAGPALSQTTERVAAHTDWAVFVGASPRECYIASPPTSSVARRDGQAVEVQRGDIRLFVSFRPGEGVANEVSFTGGYPFRSGGSVDLEIGGRTFEMAPGDTADTAEWAWTAAADDASAVAAMRQGATATVTGVSTRGTTTIDTFSLMGFTAAVTDAEARCAQ